MAQNKFDAMSRSELRKYISTHREDDEAFAAYMQRLKTDPTVMTNEWHSGSGDDQGMKKFEALIRQKDKERENKKPPTA